MGTCAVYNNYRQCTSRMVLSALERLRTRVFTASIFTSFLCLTFLYSIWPMFVTWPNVISVGAVLGDGRDHPNAPPPKHALRSPGRDMPGPHFAKLIPDKWLVAVKVALPLVR